MFTGLIEELGTVIDQMAMGSSLRLVIKAETVLNDLKIDDSIAVNGVCLTAVALDSNSFEVTAVAETLQKTTVGSLKIGEEVNLERAATLATRLGGHLVQGHVDGVAEVIEIRDLTGSWEYFFRLPDALARYATLHGSITINGVSLTLAEVLGTTVKIAIIPHTYEVTSFRTLRPGDKVNVEMDVIAKMVEHFTRQALPRQELPPEALPG